MRGQLHKASYIRMEEMQYLGQPFDVSLETAKWREAKVPNKLQV